MELMTLFLLFMIYSFIGWVIESLLCSYKARHLINRGFFIGPYLPIFGVGGILIILLLGKYQNDIFVLFVMSCVLGATLEYITSYLMEKIFNTRWWDYYEHKFNLNGRICLDATLCFGALGVIVVCVLNPFFTSLLKMLPDIWLIVLTSLLFVIFLTDVIISFNIISKIKTVNFGMGKDTTEEVTAKVREILRKRSKLTKRLVNAFPNLKVKAYDNLKKITKRNK